MSRGDALMAPDGRTVMCLYRTVCTPSAAYSVVRCCCTARARVAISHAGARTPPRSARIGMIRQAFKQRQGLRIVAGVFGQVQVVPAGGVLEQVDDADGVGGFP